MSCSWIPVWAGRAIPISVRAALDEILFPEKRGPPGNFRGSGGDFGYRHRKEETERKLAATEDNLMRIGDKVSELEIQLDPPEDPIREGKKISGHEGRIAGRGGSRVAADPG